MSWSWRAECHTCPTTRGPDYGELIRPRSESPALGPVDLWAMLHRQLHPGHDVRIARRQTIEMTLIHVNPELASILTDADLYEDDCEARTAGNCDAGEEFGALLHDCSLTDGHGGRHLCECGRNWPDSDNYPEPPL